MGPILWWKKADEQRLPERFEWVPEQICPCFLKNGIKKDYVPFRRKLGSCHFSHGTGKKKKKKNAWRWVWGMTPKFSGSLVSSPLMVRIQGEWHQARVLRQLQQEGWVMGRTIASGTHLRRDPAGNPPIAPGPWLSQHPQPFGQVRRTGIFLKRGDI